MIRRLGSRLLLLCASLLTAAGVARAEETTYQIANQLRSYFDSKQRETLLDDRLDALVRHGPYALGATFLSHSPSDYARLDPDKYGPETQGIRKRWVEAQTGKFGLRLGDVYGTFGRGLVLQIFEDQTVSFDNVLDGVSGRADLGTSHFEFVGGTNSYGEPFQVLKAVRVAQDLPGGFQAGMEGVWSDSTQANTAYRLGSDRVYGGLLKGGLSEHIDLYGEYAVRDHKNFRQGYADPPAGHAGYANLNLSAGPLQVVAEFKDLLRYKLPFVNPPTAVRQHTTTLLNRATHVPNIRLDDERGALVETYLRIRQKTNVTGSFSRSTARHSRQPAKETYGEIEQWLGEQTEVVLRLGETEETVLEGGEHVFFERITYSGSLLVSLGEHWSLDTAVETQGAQESKEETRSYSFPLEYRDNLVTLTVSKAPNMSWAVTTEWTDDERSKRTNWVWAEFNVRLSDRHQILLGGGNLRGGQVCSGGVCKLVDPFEGGRIELLTTF